MLRSYLTTAVRNLRRHPAYSAVTISGLALSLSVCLLLLLLVQDQRSYDRFHEKADRIYRIISEENGRNGRHGVAATPAYLSGAVAREVPGVEQTLRLGQIRSNLIQDGRSFTVTGLYADPAFFDFFDFPLVAGSPADALGQPNRLVLTEEAAARIFGTRDPMGQAVTLEGVGDLVVAAVVRTDGRKSHLRFDLLTSLATLEATPAGRAQLQEEHNFWSFANYVLLKEGASVRPLEAYLGRLAARYHATEQQNTFTLQALTGITLGPILGNEISAYTMPLFMVLVLAGLAGVVLLASGFNYVGLTIARSIGRAKEVGIRKAVGAGRGQVVAQFLVESVLTVLCALVGAYALLAWLVAGFNGLSFMQTFHVDLGPEQLYRLPHLGLFVAFSVAVGLLAGAYPAYYLSTARPVLVLKGAGLGAGGSRMRLRKGLTLFQLVFSLVFLTTTALLYRQLTYMVDFDYGFHTEDVVNVELQGMSYATLKGELARHPGVRTIGGTNVLPASDTNHGGEITVNQRDTIFVSQYRVDAGFLEAVEIQVVAGRPFSAASTGAPEGILLNETAARQLGFQRPADAVGRDVYLRYETEPQTVRGIVKDFQFLQVARPIEAMLLRQDPAAFIFASVRLHPGATDAFVRHLEAVWKRLDPVHPLRYGFYDTQIRDNDFTRFARDLVKIVGFAALIAVVIACLGLMSMSAFNTQLRTKEIGVRKVLGAGTGGLFWLLSREYVYLALAASVLAAPVAWFLNNLWLEQIANRVAFGPALVVAGTLVLLALALLAVGSQTARACRANPVESLRYE